jgi:hypothetical protein
MKKKDNINIQIGEITNNRHKEKKVEKDIAQHVMMLWACSFFLAHPQVVRYCH